MSNVKKYLFLLVITSLQVCAAEMQIMTEYTDSEKDVIKELRSGIAPIDVVSPMEEVTEDDKAKKVLEILKDTKRTYTPSFQKKGSSNNNLTVYRDNDQIVTVSMSTSDVIDTNICFQSPVRILLGNTITDSIFQAVADDPVSIDAKVLKDERSVFVMMKKEMRKENKIYRTRIRIIRKSDNRSYLININAQACPSSGRFGFPSEIIIEEKLAGSSSDNNKIKTPEDLILDITNGFPRKNHENQIELYGGIMSAGADYCMIAINVKVGNTTREKFYPQFYVLDSLQGRVVEMQEPIFLDKESKAVTDRVKHPILRFNLFLKINKRYIVERDSIHLVMIENGEKYYQKVRIPMSALRERLINHGYDLN
jgi:hypothetical protein